MAFTSAKSAYHEVAKLHVQSAILAWHDGPKSHASIDDALRGLSEFDIPKGPLLELFPVYNGGEEFSGVYRIGQQLEPRANLFWAVAAHIALMAMDENGLHISYQEPAPTLQQFLSEFGFDAAEYLCDLAWEGIQSVSQQYRRIRLEVDEKTLFAPLQTDDTRFDEAIFEQCGAKDEGATLVQWMEFDADLYQGLFDKLEKKRAAALMATRAPVEPA